MFFNTFFPYLLLIIYIKNMRVYVYTYYLSSLVLLKANKYFNNFLNISFNFF